MQEMINEFAPSIKFEFQKMDLTGELSFLDLRLKWDEDNSLFWDVFTKKETTIRYLNEDSLHTRVCKDGIGPGLMMRLARMTKKVEKLENVRVRDYYRDHFEALENAGNDCVC